MFMLWNYQLLDSFSIMVDRKASLKGRKQKFLYLQKTTVVCGQNKEIFSCTGIFYDCKSENKFFSSGARRGMLI